MANHLRITQYAVTELTCNRYKTMAIHTCNHSAALPVFSEHIIIKSIFNGWAIAQVASIVKFHGLSQDVSAGVPVHLWVRTGKLLATETITGHQQVNGHGGDKIESPQRLLGRECPLHPPCTPGKLKSGSE